MPKRILLADDSITIQKVVELTFSDGDYEVTAVNNGTKAIQKLSEMRPDIILSDIIMPEKNGYEVCEYVKSHPEFRTIPVVLLTGTFEPFDPDRADKAGCDAVVTKPFESQSLIHKVEELIEHARSTAPAAAAPAPAAAPAQPASSSSAPADSPFATGGFQAQGSDIFGAASAPTPAPPPGETPFDFDAPVEGATKAFPKMSFDELKQMASEPVAPTPPPAAPPPPPPAPAAPPPMEASPWDETPAAPAPKTSFNDAPPPPPAPSPAEASPWDEAPEVSGATKAFPKMSFEELNRTAAPPPPPPAPAAPEPSPWGSSASSPSAPFESHAAPSAPQAGGSPWDEPPVDSGATKAFPKMSFDELKKMADEPAAPPPPSAAAEEVPFAASSSSSMASTSSSTASSESTGPVGDLTEEQIDRIARRVVQLMSEQVVKNIAWEVIPDLAEMVVKERIKQLESEA